jgi:phosphatidate cytidylyltransferase
MNRDLRQRLAVAGVGVPLCALAAYVGGPLLAVGLGLVAAGGMWEYASMMEVAGTRVFGRSGAMAAFLFPTVVFYGGVPGGAFYGGALLMGFAAVSIATVRLEDRPLIAAAVTAFGVLYLGGLLSFGIPLREGWLGGPRVLRIDTDERLARTLFFFFPIVITWVADTAAYFGGRAFGRHRLAPMISPNKTVEGAVAAMLAATLVAPIYSRWILPGGWEFSMAIAVAFGLAVGAFAIVGDLVESALKRECGVKDASNLLPGHGGLLDRLDSLLWALPTAFFFTVLFK